ncbi:MAG: hypothetical protein KY459_07255 [Acidobacteria bacterium]|nr:hypothetical protein [Acidobacteriota bacterium]
MTESGSDRTAPGSCPRCGQPGTAVSDTIVRIMATPEALAEGMPGDPLFCRTTDCSVVYFDGSGEEIVSTGSVRVPVFSKAPDSGSTPVCYCFGHSVGAIRQRAGGEQIVSDEIRELVRVGRCACELRNPKGSCCLGDVMNLERAAFETAQGGSNAEEAETCCRV